MSEATYFKCSCQKCGGSIEFPAAGLGVGVSCPHCGETTTLFASESLADTGLPAGPPASPTLPSIPPNTDDALAVERSVGKRAGQAWKVVVGIVVILGASVGTFFYLKNRSPTPSAPDFRVSIKTNSAPAAANEPLPSPPPTPTSPKSIADLKVGAITLEKAKSGSLVYAVGLLKNDSDYARYGVRIELDLSDAKGSRASKASDYTQVIDPRKEWRFRALILDAKAVSARLSKVTEDE